MFKDGRTNFHDEEWSGRPSVISGDLVQSVDQQFVSDDASQFQNFRVNLLKFHAIFLTEFSQLGWGSRFLRKIGSENAHGYTQNT
jgi:hypothetical protein